MENMITFPNLNIGPLLIDPVAMTIMGRSVMWYGIIITFAIVLGVLYVMSRAKREKLYEDDVYDYALIVVVSAIIGARLYYVVFDPTPDYKSFYDVIAIWEGGLAIYGAVIGGAIAVFLVSKWKQVYFARIADMICPAVLLGQAVGRWGNFLNGEAYGSVKKFDFLFWSFDISDTVLSSPFLMNVNGIDAQPTFLYECVWNLVGFALILFVINKHRLFAGMTALFYFAWYGFGRMFIEGLRTDSLYIAGSDTLRVSQLIGALTFVFATVAIVVLSVRAKKYPLDESSFVYYGRRLEKLRSTGVLGNYRHIYADDTLLESTHSTLFESKDTDENDMKGSGEQ